jgi:pantoate--beta-alanine ligase
MQVISSINELQPFAGAAFVPTMGALHAGHRSLIRKASASGLPVLVSIFVNPKQFAPHEDLDSYPRTLEQDLAAASEEGAAAVFVPRVETIYPDGQSVWSPPLPAVATEPRLEDAYRPHFFGGVCGVVSRLFDLTRPALSFFGEKDWQQLKVVEAMVSDHSERWGELRIVGVSTVREPDGLALSSRNVHLHDEDRHRALAIQRALRAADGLSQAADELAMREILLDSDLVVDYAVVRNADTLGQPCDDLPKRALIAATLDGVRLIDNAPVG